MQLLQLGTQLHDLLLVLAQERILGVLIDTRLVLDVLGAIAYLSVFIVSS